MRERGSEGWRERRGAGRTGLARLRIPHHRDQAREVRGGGVVGVGPGAGGDALRGAAGLSAAAIVG